MRASLVDALLARIDHVPDHTCLIFLHPDGSEERVTYEQLHRDALRYAALLRAADVPPGELLFLVFEHTYALVASFWGAIYYGAIPSIFPYYNPRVSLAAFKQRIARHLKAAGAQAIITDSRFAAELRDVFDSVAYPVLALSGDEAAAPNGCFLSQRAGKESAYIQFSSGTTGSPKGVVLSHDAILEHLTSLAAGLEFDAQDVTVGWLPLYHDMGLIMQLLLPLLHGACSVLLAPEHWVRRPATLLRAIHTYAGTMSWMPNFAFNHCVRYVRDEEIAGCDLGSWRILGNGAELVQWESLQAFAKRFEPYHFRASALMVGYGMAENVVGVTLSPVATAPHREWVRVEEAAATQRVLPVSEATPDAKVMVSCGSAIPGTTLAIVDEAGKVLPERHIGEVVLQGNSLFSTYYHQPELTARAMRGGWFHTGDLGYLAEGELYVYERKADILIVGGHNVRPFDIEQIAQSELQTVKGESVAFGLFDQELGTELPIVVCEVRGQGSEADERALSRRIRQRVLQELDITLADVYFVRRGWMIKTTSGKIARAANQQKYLAERGSL